MAVLLAELLEGLSSRDNGVLNKKSKQLWFWEECDKLYSVILIKKKKRTKVKNCLELL